jgi:hypothetical protein
MLAGDPETRRAALLDAISQLDRAAQKGVLHRNNAARRKSRLMKQFARLGTVPVRIEAAPPVQVEPEAAPKPRREPTRRRTARKEPEAEAQPEAEAPVATKAKPKEEPKPKSGAKKATPRARTAKKSE